MYSHTTQAGTRSPPPPTRQGGHQTGKKLKAQKREQTYNHKKLE